MSDRVISIIETVRGLTRDELGEFTAMLSLELPKYAVYSQDLKNIEEVFPAFEEVLKKSSIDVGPYERILKSKLKDDFINGCKIILEYYNKYFMDKERNLILKNLLTIIINYLKEKNVPISIKSLSQQMKNVEYVVDYCFPNYKESNLLHLILLPEQDLRQGK